MTAERRSYQERVTQLLERIDAYSRKRLRLETAGVRRPLLAPLDEKLERMRAELAAVVGTRVARSSGESCAPTRAAKPDTHPASGQRSPAAARTSRTIPRKFGTSGLLSSRLQAMATTAGSIPSAWT
jgi:hypothetical protein